MKKTYNWIIMITAMLALFAIITPPAEAQQYAGTTVLANGYVTQQATSNRTESATLTKYEDCALQITYIAGSAGVSNVAFFFKRSLDGSTTETANTWQVNVPGNGTSTACLITNLPSTFIGAAGYLHLSSITNGFQATYVTNINVKVYTKPKRFGN